MYNLTHCLIYHKILISMTVIKDRFYWIEMFYTSHFSSLNSLPEYFQHSVYSATKFGFHWLSFKTGLTVYKHYIIYIYLIPTHSVGSVCRQPSPTKREGPIRCPTPWFLPKKTNFQWRTKTSAFHTKALSQYLTKKISGLKNPGFLTFSISF